ncbi:MAG: helix-turn-helix transcriptional regulator [FCB group bacterium]|nr:helix-turn-helix transcriptional regulator [FCB group bacterium]
MTLLKDGEMSVSSIVEHFSMKQPSISHHLQVLRNAGVVKSRKEGKEIFYSLDLCCIEDCCIGFRNKFTKGTD